MPTYVYKCRKCGREFEVEQKITDEPLKKCVYEGCDGEVFRKISANVGFSFKGSGFYLTDYGKRHGSSSNGYHGSDGHNGAAAEKTPSNGEAKASSAEKTAKKEPAKAESKS